MKNLRKFAAFALAIVLMLSLCTGCGDGKDNGNQKAEGDYSYHWKLATTETSDYYMTVLAQEFLDKVSERTGGKVTGEVFASGQLGGLVDALEGLELGTVDIVMDGFSSLGEVNPLFDVWGMPYLYDNDEHRDKFWDEYFDECAELVAEKANIRMVTVLDGLNRNLSCTKAVNNLNDLKGLKIRGFCIRVVCPYDKGSRAVCNDVIGDIHADLVIRKIVRAEVRPVISEKHEHIRIIKAV